MGYVFTQRNSDDLLKAVQGLNQFCKNWCMNCAETTRTNDLVFRCGECPFQNPENGECQIKKFTHDREEDLKKLGFEFVDFGSMGSL